MPLPIILSGNVASALGGAYEVANSCRFDAASGAYMSKSLGTPTNAKKATFSAWIKRCSLGTHSNSTDSGGQGIVTFKPSNGNFDTWKFNNVDKIDFYSEVSSLQKYWVADGPEQFRDVGAWYHIVIALDSTQSTAANRFKYYINGTQLTSPTQTSYIAQDSDHVGLASGSTVYVGLGKAHNTNVLYSDFYMAEVCFIDGTQYAASDFGEFDSDSPTIWKPKDPSGLTFGNNGFYLDFEDSSNLGNDANGGTDLSETNLAATDQATDTPTNNFCTLNPLAPYGISGTTWSEGNLNLYHLQDSGVPCNFFVNKGKWYWENKIGAESDAQYTAMGIVSESVVASGDMSDASYAGGFTDYGGDDLAYAYQGANGHLLTNDALSSGWGDTYAANDIISVALDLDNNKLYFAKNGTWQNSGDPTSGATGTGAVSITNTYYTPLIQSFSGSSTNARLNFGGGCSWTVSSANSDADGGGTTFEYSVPSGYFALCTKNLANYG